MSSANSSSAIESAVEELLANCSPDVRVLAASARALVREAIPDASEEIDITGKLLGYTFIPGTYKGLIMAIQVHRAHLNLVFSKGVELMELDREGLLEGAGKLARHIKVGSADRLGAPGVRRLIEAAGARTPR